MELKTNTPAGKYDEAENAWKEFWLKLTGSVWKGDLYPAKYPAIIQAADVLIRQGAEICGLTQPATSEIEAACTLINSMPINRGTYNPAVHTNSKTVWFIASLMRSLAKSSAPASDEPDPIVKIEITRESGKVDTILS